MANKDNPSGLKVAKHANGGTHRPNRYFIASGLASNIFRGDGVIPVNTNKRINVAAATNRLIGVFQGVSYVNAQGEPKFDKFWPTGTTLQTGSLAEALVWDDPNLLFEVQGDEDIVEADLGAFADLVVGAGSTTTGISAMELDSSTVGSGDTLRIEEFVDRPDNERDVNFARVLVRITKHYLAGALTAI